MKGPEGRRAAHRKAARIEAVLEARIERDRIRRASFEMLGSRTRAEVAGMDPVVQYLPGS